MTELYLVWLAAGDLPSADSAALALTRFPCVLGRHSSCDHCLPDPAISRRHCAFTVCEGRVWVRDLGSLNGTQLNGQPLAGARALSDGDRLDLAHWSFRVLLAGGPAEGPRSGVVVHAAAPSAPGPGGGTP
jgi:predicted component of type VI protein secretion system